MPYNQDWFDDNRKRFDAETSVIVDMPKGCKHKFQKVGGHRVKCGKCNAGWFFSIEQMKELDAKGTFT